MVFSEVSKKLKLFLKLNLFLHFQLNPYLIFLFHNTTKVFSMIFKNNNGEFSLKINSVLVLIPKTSSDCKLMILACCDLSLTLVGWNTSVINNGWFDFTGIAYN